MVRDKNDISEEIIITEAPEMLERVVGVDRISRTVKGGRRIRFRALIIIGDRNGKVGMGVAKANDVQTAIAKAKNKANKSMIEVPIVNDSIAHEVMQVFGTTRVILKPAPKGHSIIAGGAVRSVVELCGIKNIVSKSLGSSNAINNATATFLALQQLKVNPVKRGQK
jgi:small subunit ribosomal protein S5